MSRRCPTCGEYDGHRFLTDEEIAEASARELVVHFMPLAIALANRIRRDCQDTQGDAFLGLVRAAQNYDHNRGAKFVSLATIEIRKATLRGSSRQQGAISLPPDVRTRLTAVQDARARLGDHCTADEIAIALGWPWTAQEVRHLLAIPRTVSVEGIEREDDEGRSDEQWLADPESHTEFEAMLARNDLFTVIDDLPADLGESISRWLDEPESQRSLERIGEAGRAYMAGETLL